MDTTANQAATTDHLYLNCFFGNGKRYDPVTPVEHKHLTPKPPLIPGHLTLEGFLGRQAYTVLGTINPFTRVGVQLQWLKQA